MTEMLVYPSSIGAEKHYKEDLSSCHPREQLLGDIPVTATDSGGRVAGRGTSMEG